MGNILILDDEQGMREMLQMMLEEEGYNVTTVSSISEAVTAVRENVYDLVISDLKLGDGNGIDFLTTLKDVSPITSFIIITAFATLESALNAIKLGAYDYVIKPFKIDVMRNSVRKAFEKKMLLEENLYLRNIVNKENVYDTIISENPKMKELIALSTKAAKSDSNILITGASGSGKEMFARFIHKNSPRADGPFVAVNCGALTETLLESELFGYVAGAFTGADKNRDGLFVVANNGTIFLDEVTETSNNFQVKLLRVIQEMEIRPVGSRNIKKIDVRVITATNKEIMGEVESGSFRSDLFYRLNVIPIHIPSLKERYSDIPYLAEYFLEKFSNGSKKLARESVDLLMGYDFPGNVRELQNIMERVCVLTNGSLITPRDLSFLVNSGGSAGNGEEPMNLISLSVVEREHIINVLNACEGNKSRAAEVLGVSRKFIYSKIKEYGLEKNEA